MTFYNCHHIPGEVEDDSAQGRRIIEVYLLLYPRIFSLWRILWHQKFYTSPTPNIFNILVNGIDKNNSSGDKVEV